MGPVIIQTERLDLRAWTDADRAAFGLIAHEPDIVRWLNNGEPLSAEQMDAFVSNQIKHQRDRGWCRWALELREPAEGDPEGIVGFCGFGCNLAPDVELGWALLPTLWGRGLATEAGRAALDYGFSTVRFERVYSAIVPENAAMRAVAEKVGLVLDGVFLAEGEPTLRYVAHDPHPDAPIDPRFVRTCEGSVSSLRRGRTTR